MKVEEMTAVPVGPVRIEECDHYLNNRVLVTLTFPIAIRNVE
jgi:hypothetical protein